VKSVKSVSNKKNM